MNTWNKRESDVKRLLSSNKKDLLHRVQHDYERAYRAKRKVMAKWIKHLLAVDGRYDKRVMDDMSIRDYDDKIPSKYNENRYPQILRIVVSKLTSGRINTRVQRMSNSMEDIYIAEASSLLLKKMWNDLNIQLDIIKRLGVWVGITGMGITKTIWLKNRRYEGPSRPLNLKLSNIVDDSMPGYPFIRPVHPFNFIMDEFASDPDNANMVGELIHMPKRQFYARWPNKYEKEENGERPRNIVFPATIGEKDPTFDQNDVITVFEMYYKPSEKHRKGEYILATANQILEYEREKDIYIPYDYISDIQLKDNWGSSLMEGTVEIQNEIVSIERKKSIHMAFVARPVQLLPDDQKIREDQFVPGGQVRYSMQKGEPKWMQLNSAVTALGDQANQLRHVHADVVGVHPVSHGAAQGVESGRAMNILEQQDATKLGMLKIGLVNYIKGVSAKLLKLWKWNMPQEVSLRLGDATYASEFIAFHGSRINSFDVYIEDEEAIMRSEEFLLMRDREELQYGGISQEEYRARRWRRQALKSPDYAYAQQENLMMIQGVQVAPSWWENHRAHWEAHRQFMMTPQYRALDKMRQRIFEAHLEVTAMKIHEAAGAMYPIPPGAQQQLPPQGQQPGVNIQEESMDAL